MVTHGITCQQGWEHSACPAACRCLEEMQGHPVQSLGKSRHGESETENSSGRKRL